jgi:hypothetical protein
MTILANLPITTAVAAQVTAPVEFDVKPLSAALQANLVYGSGGTTIDAWVQTSLDGGATWTDVANFHLTTSSARKIVNLSSLTPETTQVTPTDGSLSANTAQDGVIGSLWRVKYTTTGTYAGSTTLRVDIEAQGKPHAATAE